MYKTVWEKTVTLEIRRRIYSKVDTNNMKTMPGLRLKISNKMEIGAAVRDALLVAKAQGRLTCGVYESGKILEMDPDGVMLCVLPNNASDDVTLHIHFTLIEAFCWENAIRLLKVDSVEKLAKVLGDRPINDNDIAAGRTSCLTQDFNCILLGYPAEECSEVEEDVLEFCKVTSDLTPQPVVELQV